MTRVTIKAPIYEFCCSTPQGPVGSWECISLLSLLYPSCESIPHFSPGLPFCAAAAPEGIYRYIPSTDSFLRKGLLSMCNSQVVECMDSWCLDSISHRERERDKYEKEGRITRSLVI